MSTTDTTPPPTVLLRSIPLRRGDPQHTHLNTPTARRQLFQGAEDVPVTYHEIGLLDGSIQPTPYKELVEKTFKKVFDPIEDLLTLEDVTTDRIVCAYRLTRHLAQYQNFIELDEPLLMVCDNGHVWNTPRPSTIFRRHQNNKIAIEAQALNFAAENIAAAENPLANTVLYTILKNSPHTIPLLPPSLPTDNTDLETYDPTFDPRLNTYLDALQSAANYLGTYNGTPANPDLGRNGMAGLLSPWLTRLAFPTKSQLLAYEFILINETLHSLLQKGNYRTYMGLLQRLNYTHEETQGLIRMARQFAVALTRQTIEQERAMMVMRCENIAMAAKESLDLKQEHNSYKQMSAILGLTRTKADDDLSDFTAMVKEATAARKLPAPDPLAAIPTVI